MIAKRRTSKMQIAVSSSTGGFWLVLLRLRVWALRRGDWFVGDVSLLVTLSCRVFDALWSIFPLVTPDCRWDGIGMIRVACWPAEWLNNSESGVLVGIADNGFASSWFSVTVGDIAVKSGIDELPEGTDLVVGICSDSILVDGSGSIARFVCWQSEHVQFLDLIFPEPPSIRDLT